MDPLYGSRRVAAACLVLCLSVCGAAFAQPLLLRNPSLSKDRIAFLYADDVWTVSREGGEARRLTSMRAVESGPYFSPDGTRIAFSARLHGVSAVYVVGSDGGVARQLTWEPTGSYTVGWTPDGKEVLFASMHASVSDFFQLYRVHADGTGYPSVLPLPSALEGAISPDGTTIAYEPILQWQDAWKHYRGGQTKKVWLVNLKTLDLVKVPRENSNDFNPVWVGDKVYFLSDRNGAVSLFEYETRSKKVSQTLENRGFDLKTMAAGPGALVYEQFGSLHLYDLTTKVEHEVKVSVGGDLPEMVPQLTNIAAHEVHNLGVSPTGVRLVVEAHGDIFTLPAEKGDTRNLTRTPGAAERDPAWSPDGKSIAYFSDASGEYQLYIRNQDGLSAPKVVDLGASPSFFYAPKWSPDSKRIAYSDKHLNLWIVDVADGKRVKVDRGVRGSFGGSFDVSWSPDSTWLAYTRDLENELHAVFAYSLASGKATQITDGMSNALHPRFDAGGKYLYFAASTNNGPSDAGIDLSSLDRATDSSVYVVVLKRFGVSPVPPESDEEKKAEESADKKDDTPKTDAKGDEPAKSDGKDEKKWDEKKPEEKKPVEPTVIDLEGIGDRVLSLPIPARNYMDLQVGKSGVLFLAEGGPVGRSSNEGESAPIRSLWKFTTEKRETEEVLRGLSGMVVSANGEKLVYAKGENFFEVATSELKPGSPDSSPGKPVSNTGMYAIVDPRAEYKQMFVETWRIERDFLYDPGLHGLDVKKIEAKYAPYLDGISARSEFTYLSNEMLGEIQIGHMFVGGPSTKDDAPKPGLLGADYTFDDSVPGGRYKFAKIYNGQNWTPSLRAPLTLPGINIRAGAYLLAVNGRELHATDNVDQSLDGTAGKQTVLRVGRKADGSDGRDVTVIPTDSEHGLRNLDWIEGNRKKVGELSGGKVAYVYMPNTAGAGYTNFNRYFYSQLDKQALVLDERYNEGGLIADYIVNLLSQKPLSGAIERDGEALHDPVAAIFGPKAMIINQSAGSGGDAMPWYFRKAGLGTLVGTKTWGGLVGIGGYPTLLDGGSVTAPRYAIYGLHGEFEVEGHGIAPDVEVEELPKDVAAGHDTQLERAVAVVLEQLKANPIPEIRVPPYPNYHKADGLN